MLNRTNPYRADTFYNANPQYQRFREMGLNELLLENRIIFLDLPLDPTFYTNLGTVCSVVIKSMLYLQSMKKDQEIGMYINCPGGSVEDTLAIYDTMNFLSCDVATYCVGRAASGGAVILAAGTKGKRYALPNAKVMLHQPWGGSGGQASDMKIQVAEIQRAKEALLTILAKHTGMDQDKLRAETERDRYMDAVQAKEYGVIDEVLEHVKEDE